MAQLLDYIYINKCTFYQHSGSESKLSLSVESDLVKEISTCRKLYKVVKRGELNSVIY